MNLQLEVAGGMIRRKKGAVAMPLCTSTSVGEKCLCVVPLVEAAP